MLPLFAIANLVFPDAEASKISPELVWLTTRAPLLPIPTEITRGEEGIEGVDGLEPMKTPESASEERTMLPEPFGVSVRLLLLPVVASVVPEMERLFVPKS